MGFFSKDEKSKIILLRGIKTFFFLIYMLFSFLLFSAPVLLVIADTFIPSAFLSATLAPTSFSLHTLYFHLVHYDFRYSLIDIPLISIIRSAIILCKCKNMLSLLVSFMCNHTFTEIRTFDSCVNCKNLDVI